MNKNMDRSIAVLACIGMLTLTIIGIYVLVLGYNVLTSVYSNEHYYMLRGS